MQHVRHTDGLALREQWAASPGAAEELLGVLQCQG